MAIHTDLPIYRKGVQLLDFAVQAQPHMRRELKRPLGDRITEHCVSILDEMALANASQHHKRAAHLQQLLVHQRALTVLFRVAHDSGNLSQQRWARSIELLGSIGRQAGGWLNSTNRAPAA